MEHTCTSRLPRRTPSGQDTMPSPTHSPSPSALRHATKPASTDEPGLAPIPAWILGQIRVDEDWYGPVPDVLATQGAHLLPRPSTPVFAPDIDELLFPSKLCKKLEFQLFLVQWRTDRYGRDVAEGWPRGRTPVEARREAKLRDRSRDRARMKTTSATSSEIEDELNDIWPLTPITPVPAVTPAPSPPALVSATHSNSAIQRHYSQTDSDTTSSTKKRTLEQVETSEPPLDQRHKRPKSNHTPEALNEPVCNGDELTQATQDANATLRHQPTNKSLELEATRPSSTQSAAASETHSRHQKQSLKTSEADGHKTDEDLHRSTVEPQAFTEENEPTGASELPQAAQSLRNSPDLGRPARASRRKSSRRVTRRRTDQARAPSNL